MTLRKKILVGSLLTLIPLAVFAQDKHHEDKIYYKNHANANYEFEGRLQQMPSNGLNGIWVIAGKKVIVDNTTYIKQERKNILLGDIFEVKVLRTANEYKAVKLEQED